MELSKEEEDTGGKGMLGKSDSGKETGLKHRVITGRNLLIIILADKSSETK